MEKLGHRTPAPGSGVILALAPYGCGDVEPTVLTIVGTTFPRGEVTVTAGASPLAKGTAGEDGRYRIGLDAVGADDILYVRAQHPTDRFLEMASVLGPGDDLLRRAGRDGVLDEGEAGETRINGFTTALYAALLWANAGAPPADPTTFETARWRSTGSFTLIGRPLADLGAHFQRWVADQQSRPRASSLLELAADPGATYAATADLDSAALSDLLSSDFLDFTEVEGSWQISWTEGNGYAGAGTS